MAALTRLERYDFNAGSGILGAAAACIGISLAFFSVVYLIEGIGWLGSKTHAWVGWNWLRGSGVTILISLILLGVARSRLAASARKQEKAQPLFNKLDLNAAKGMLGLALLCISAVFFFNGILYRQEGSRWYWAGIETAKEWMFQESSSWYTSSAVMIIIGVVLCAAGWACVALQWRRTD